MRVGRGGIGRRVDAKLARHPQVGAERLGGYAMVRSKRQRQPQELATPDRTGDGGAGQAPLKFRSSAGQEPRDGLASHLHRNNGGTGHEGREPRADGFDLGKPPACVRRGQETVGSEPSEPVMAS
ncbi:hypothetical protein GCM10025876_05890 [Demequina litorisediminis]|uniref:Uncharacterized protein n=1 Tax=Demequina litorisediminis TaxID=1849022 RepID=A0ABQ6I9H9_9MICO|nr:hypothetical protein GCM10025876_05890 [Demequina litorisediminis]